MISWKGFRVNDIKTGSIESSVLNSFGESTVEGILVDHSSTSSIHKDCAGFHFVENLEGEKNRRVNWTQCGNDKGKYIPRR